MATKFIGFLLVQYEMLGLLQRVRDRVGDRSSDSNTFLLHWRIPPPARSIASSEWLEASCGYGFLRSMLVESAWTIYRHNAWAQVFVNEISHGSKARRKLAIVALAKKVLIILWGMLKSNQPFRSPETSAAAAAG